VKKWMLLSGAIGAEVLGTIALRATVENPAWLLLVVVAYVAAFGMFGVALRHGIPVGVAYGIWGASGVALVAMLGAIVFDEALSLPSIAGISLIVLGVVVVETSSPHQTTDVGEP
jgi:small multidrug resistance pump